MGLIILLIALVVAVSVLVMLPRLPGGLRPLGVALAALIVLGGFVLGSVRYISADEVGIVVKNVGFKRLQGGAYIATDGEQGIQADVLAPGWHFGYWPVIYDVRETALTEVPAGQIGIIEARDGQMLPPGQVIAPEWPRESFQKMLDARYFLTEGGGYKGTQASVLTPGKYRLNTELFRVKMVDQTEVLPGEVAVLKANFGRPPTMVVPGPGGLLESAQGNVEAGDEDRLRLAGEGEMGIRAEPLPPGKYPINTDAYNVVELWTTQMIAHYTALDAGNPVYEGAPDGEPGREPTLSEREITVRTSDGFTFPVDVRVEYVIEPANAPIVVAKLGDDEGERFRAAFNSAVRAIFRNNAEKVRALDYVQQRSIQEQQSLEMLADQMARFGVTVTAVRIGDVGDEQSLGALLKTQTDREIAKQEQITFQEQQKTAEQKKLLSRAIQEAEEEKRLATAAYEVKIAEEQKKQRLIEAEAQAQATLINARAQADAYRQIAEQIGKGNAALIELLKVVGERQIQITPRVMITGGANGHAPRDPEAIALIGTMLDLMTGRDEAAPPAPPAVVEPAQSTAGH